MPIVGSFAGASSRAYGFQSGLIGDYESITSTTVGSGGVSEIIFSSIPQTYTHLQIRFFGLTGNDQVMQFNSDTGNNYKSHYLFGQGTSAASAVIAPTNYVYFGFSGGNANPYVGVIDILDYANTNKNKTMRAIAGTDANGSGYAFLTSGVWFSNNAITSIRLFPTSGSFSQYTNAALYGIKG